LEKSKIPYLRLDTDKLLTRIAISYGCGKPAIKIDGQWYKADDISNIWYRRPEKLKDDRFDDSAESRYALAEWAEFIECFFAHVPKIKWMNHPSCNALASRKLEQLTTATTLGFTIPDALATQQPDALRDFFRKHNGKVVVKPLSTAYIERTGEEKDSLIYTNLVSEHHLNNLDDLSLCPTFFQQFIQKQSDVRITVVDSDIHAVTLKATDKPGEQRCDIRRNNMSDVVYEIISLPEDIKVGIQNLMAHYSLRFAAIDMAVSTAGDWYFFEVNPNGQWAWLDMSAGMNISASLIKAFAENIHQQFQANSSSQ
jgi:glutathione synthase/RimK-type ligase-like ATP-grasp enzyme